MAFLCSAAVDFEVHSSLDLAVVAFQVLVVAEFLFAVDALPVALILVRFHDRFDER